MFANEIKSRDSAVGMATGYGLDDQGFGIRVPVEAKTVIPQRRPDRLWGPSSLISNGYKGEGLSQGVKRLGREAHHSSPTSAEVKKTWIYTSTPPYAFMTYCLISSAQGQFRGHANEGDFF
jgi:hypothetical protein